MMRLFLATNGTYLNRKHEQALRTKLAEYLTSRGFMSEFREEGLCYTMPCEGRVIRVLPERPSIDKPAYAVYAASEKDKEHEQALRHIFESVGFAIVA